MNNLQNNKLKLTGETKFIEYFASKYVKTISYLISIAGLLVAGGADFGRNSQLPNTASSASLTEVKEHQYITSFFFFLEAFLSRSL